MQQRRRILPGIWVLAGLVAAALAGADTDGSATMGPESNLLQNPRFNAHDADGVVTGWTLSGQARGETDRSGVPDGAVCYRVEVERGEAILQQQVKAAPQQQYFFSMRVRSNGRVVVSLGTLTASYHRQDEWQDLAGVALSDATGTLTVRVSCRPLGGTPQEVWLADAILHPAKQPPTPARKGRFDQTLLVRDGEPAATVVYPADRDDYRAMANRVADAVRQVAGVALPVVSDIEATQPGPPELRDECRSRNLILLGRLGINRAMWPAYSRFLCGVDGYYPGADGFVVRTAANVFADGHNHIIIGGSSDAGARRAADRFLAALPRAATDGALALPYLLDVELGGECLETFRERDERWRTDSVDSVLPRVEPGYGNVRRWYENAMGYYWSGWDTYRKRAGELLEIVLQEKAYTHHYILEFFARTYRTVGECPLLTDRQRDELDELLLSNFWEFMYGQDVIWFGTLSPPYDDVKIVSRHVIAPLMAELVLCNFLDDHLELEGELADIVRFRLSEKRGFMDSMVAHRAGPSIPESSEPGAWEEIVASMFRYALEYGRYEFFDGGNARAALSLDMIDHRSGYLVRPPDRPDMRLMFGAMAHYFRNGIYLSLSETLPRTLGVTGDFMGRYIYGVGLYSPGPEVAEASLERLAGMTLPRALPYVQEDLPRLGVGRYQRTELGPEDAFNFVAFRGGFAPDDDYLAISGLATACVPGAVLGLSSGGRHWLRSASQAYFGQNALHVLRTDRFVDDPKPYPSVARLNWSREMPEGGAIAFTLEPFAGTRWQRSVVWINPGVFVIRDRVTPAETGDYMLSANWHLNGVIQEQGDAYTLINGSGRMRISTLGEGVRTTHLYDHDGSMTHLRLVRSGHMQAGETATMVTVLQVAHPGKAPTYAVTHAAPDQLILAPEEGNAPAIAISSPADDAPMAVTHPSPEWAARALAVQRPDAAGVGETPVAAPDASADWRVAWEYKGLLRAARVQPARRISAELVDLGRVVKLDEIRAITRGAWHPATFAGEVAVAVPGEDGNMPPLDGPGWQQVTAKPQWHEGIRSGNYGEAVPLAQTFQYMALKGLEARYIRAPEIDALVFYEQGHREARRPLSLHTCELRADGETAILVKPRPYPKFIRGWQLEDDALALLNGDGTELFQHEPPQRIQEACLLDYLGTGAKQLVLATADARIQVFSPTGDRLRDMDMYRMHYHFNDTEGRPNTRHPAGLYTMPYSLGAWRRGPDGVARLAISRYCAFSFIDHEGNYEGVLHTAGAAGYVTLNMLPEGIDFNGDGREEQVCLGRGVVFRLGGDSAPYVTQPNGALFYPQVYTVEGLQEPAWTESLEGPFTFVFEPVRLGDERQRYILIARGNYVGVYDGRDHDWAFNWVPVVEINAAAVWRPAADQVALSAVTDDGIVWSFRWDGDLRAEPQRALQPIGALEGKINGMAATDSGDLLIAASTGLYLWRTGELSSIAPGGFTDVAILRDKSANAIIAARNDGTIIRLDGPQ